MIHVNEILAQDGELIKNCIDSIVEILLIYRKKTEIIEMTVSRITSKEKEEGTWEKHFWMDWPSGTGNERQLDWVEAPRTAHNHGQDLSGWHLMIGEDFFKIPKESENLENTHQMLWWHYN